MLKHFAPLLINILSLISCTDLFNHCEDNSSWFMMGNGKDTLKHQFAIIKYIEIKTQDSPCYYPILIQNYYLTNTNKNKDEFVIKHIYRLGNNAPNKYY